MPYDGTHQPLYLPDGACPGVELSGDHPRDARPSRRKRSRGGPAQRKEIHGGLRTAEPWERVVELMVGARL